MESGCVFLSRLMTGQRKLLTLWVWLLLMAALCPGVQYAYSKRGGSAKGRGGKSDESKASPSQSRGLSKQGLKWAGAAAAGMLGGTGTGYGLGFLGKNKHGGGGRHGHGVPQQDQKQHQHERQGFRNQSLWRVFVRGAAPAPATNVLLTLGHVMCFMVVAWIRNI